MWWKEPPDLKHNICAGHYEIFIFQNVGLYLFISFSNERVNTVLLNGLRRRYHLFYKMSQMGGRKKKEKSLDRLTKEIKLSWFASNAGAGKGKKLFLVEGISF